MNIEKIMNWLSARWSEPSTQRSVPVFAIALVAVVYAIAKGEPSSAILAAGVMLYTALNSITPSP